MDQPIDQLIPHIDTHRRRARQAERLLAARGGGHVCCVCPLLGGEVRCTNVSVTASNIRG